MRKILALFLIIGIISTQALIVNADTYYREYYEDEFNNTIETADVYSIYGDYTFLYGTVNDFDHTDYFKLIATKSGILDLYLKFDIAKASSNIDIDLYLYDSSQKNIRFIASWDGSERIDLKLKKDDYIYIRIDHDTGFLSEPYSIRFNM